MGAVVAAVVASVVSYGTASVVAFAVPGIGAFGAYMIGGLAGMATSMIGGALLGGGAKAKSGDLGSTATERKLTLRSSIESRKLNYGTCMVSGPLALKVTTGATKEYLHLVVVLSGRKVSAIREVNFDGTLATASRISAFNRVNLHLGSIRQEADPDLVAEIPGWSTAHRGRGIAAIYARLKYDATAWPNGIKNVQAVLQGHALYDPRLVVKSIASTIAGTPAVIHTSAPHGLVVDDEVFILGHPDLAKYYTVDTVPSTTSLTLVDPVSGEPLALASGSTGGSLSKMRWSNNFALGVLDYMLWGDGLNSYLSEINADYWIAAANVSDEQVLLGATAACTADAGTDVITLAEAVPWQTGLQVGLTSTGTLPGGVSAGTAYAWVRLTATTGKLAATKEDALYGLGIDITSAGSGTHTISAALACTVSTSANSVSLTDSVPRDDTPGDDQDQDEISPQFGWDTGDGVQFCQGTPPAGCALSTTYYWIRLTNASGQLATTHDNAIAGTALTLADAGSGLTMARVSQPRYTVNGQLDLGNKPIDNMDKLLTAGGGVIPYVQGMYRLHAAAATTPTFELTASDLRGNIKVQAKPAKRDTFNAVRGTFVDPTQLWQPADLPPVVSSQYQAEDNGEQIWKDVEQPFTTDAMRGQRNLKTILECGRQGMVVDFPARLTAGPGSTVEIAPWDVGAVTISQLGFEDKLFRCIDWKLAEDLGIDLVLQEYAAACFGSNPGDMAHPDYAPNTTLANPWDVAAPTALALESGTDVLAIRGDGMVATRLKCSWTAPADAFVLSGGHIDTQLKKSADSAWLPAATVRGDDTECYLLDVEDGTAYDVRIRAANGLGAVSAWLTVTGHTVVGKTLPPPALTGLYRQGDTISWTYNAPPPDFAGFRVRVLAGLTRNWEKGADYPSTGALVQERSLSIGGLGAGVTTIMVRPQDTSGNLATSASFLTINLGEPSPENLVSTSDEKASGFTGAIVNGSVNEAGNLVADDTGDAYLPDGLSLYLPQPTALYLPLNYVAMSYEWAYVPDAADVPGTLRLSAAVGGDGWTVEYRRRGSGGVYLEHDDGAYLADGAALSLGGPTPWANMPGNGISVGRERLDFRISTDAGSRQGIVSALTVNIDVQDITESFDDVVVSSTGTRLPITKTYRAIDYIGAITLQDDSHGATGVVVLDKNPTLGPMLAAVGASQATIDIYNLKGY